MSDQEERNIELVKKLNQRIILCRSNEGIFGCRIESCTLEDGRIRTEVTLRKYRGRSVDAFIFSPRDDRWHIHFKDRSPPHEIPHVELLPLRSAH